MYCDVFSVLVCTAMHNAILISIRSLAYACAHRHGLPCVCVRAKAWLAKRTARMALRQVRTASPAREALSSPVLRACVCASPFAPALCPFCTVKTENICCCNVWIALVLYFAFNLCFRPCLVAPYDTVSFPVAFDGNYQKNTDIIMKVHDTHLFACRPWLQQKNGI